MRHKGVERIVPAPRVVALEGADFEVVDRAVDVVLTPDNVVAPLEVVSGDPRVGGTDVVVAFDMIPCDHGAVFPELLSDFS